MPHMAADPPATCPIWQVRLLGEPVKSDSSMRKVVCVGPPATVDGFEALFKESLGRELARGTRREGEPPPPKELRASSVTFVPFCRGAEQDPEALERCATSP